MTLGKLRRETERLADIGFFEIEKVSQQVWDGASRTEGFHDHANREAHSANARFAAHYFRIQRDSRKRGHGHQFTGLAVFPSPRLSQVLVVPSLGYPTAARIPLHPAARQTQRRSEPARSNA